MPENGLLGFTVGVQRVDHAPIRGTRTKWAGTAPRPAGVAPPRTPHRIPGESHGRRSCPRFGPAPAPPTAPVRLGTKCRDRSGHISNRPGPSPRPAPDRQAPGRDRRTQSWPSPRLVGLSRDTAPTRAVVGLLELEDPHIMEPLSLKSPDAIVRRRHAKSSGADLLPIPNSGIVRLSCPGCSDRESQPDVQIRDNHCHGLRNPAAGPGKTSSGARHTRGPGQVRR